MKPMLLRRTLEEVPILGLPHVAVVAHKPFPVVFLDGLVDGGKGILLTQVLDPRPLLGLDRFDFGIFPTLVSVKFVASVPQMENEIFPGRRDFPRLVDGLFHQIVSRRIPRPLGKVEIAGRFPLGILDDG